MTTGATRYASGVPYELREDWTRMSFPLPRDMHAALKILAIRRGKTTAELLRDLITAELDAADPSDK